MYNDKVLDHFKNPRNMGELNEADVCGEYSNLICGDLIFIYIKVSERDGKEIIEDISFQTFGCAAAIATSSMITELAKGMTLEEAKSLTRDDIANSLGGLPPQKLHCSNLAADALHDAIEKYYSKKSSQ